MTPPQSGTTKTPIWTVPPECLVIGPQEVHLWRANLHLQQTALSALWSVLSAGERQRASRINSPFGSERQIAARGQLRVILSRYVDLPPERLRFSYGPQGKPALPSPHGGVRFNLSHSGDLLVCAVSGNGEIGVDIEFIRPDRDPLGIARRFFTAGESADLAALPATLRCAAFYRTWCRKEAFIKALGRGLASELSRFRVSVAPSSPATLISWEEPRADLSGWFLADFVPAPGYAGAVATSGHPNITRFLELSPPA